MPSPTDRVCFLGGRNSLRRAFILGLVVACWAFPGSTDAQIKYSPEHPDVRAMADAAVNSMFNRRMDKRVGTLSALAYVEYYKRYFGSVPRGNEFVESNIAAVLGDLPEGDEVEGLLDEDEMYYPSLALILLAEFDSKKYDKEIKQILKMIARRQRPNGAFTYKRQPNSGDTSQTQFACLALFVAKHHKFDFDPEIAKRALNWLCNAKQPGGTWKYKLVNNGSESDVGRPDNQSPVSLSMHCSGLSTIYLLADVLNLNPRKVSMASKTAKDNGLPPTVTMYVPPVEGRTNSLAKEGPLVSFDRGKLNSATRDGNLWIGQRYTPEAPEWSMYYLYAMERYAYFREQAEGDVNGIDDWYDQAIDSFKQLQEEKTGRFLGGQKETALQATALAVLVMVRASEIIVGQTGDTEMLGDLGFKQDEVLREGTDGTIRSVSAEKDLGDVLEMLKSDKVNSEQLAELTEALKKQIVEFRNKDSKSRVEIKSFLRTMLGAKEYYRRLIAIRFLAGEQDMDNVPALLYALGDPDFRICLEAHNGLRLVSRKIDSMEISDFAKKNATRDYLAVKGEPATDNQLRLEFNDMKKRWTNWFLKIRPNAELLD